METGSSALVVTGRIEHMLKVFQSKVVKIAEHCADLVDFCLLNSMRFEVSGESDEQSEAISRAEKWLETVFRYVNEGVCLLEHITNLLERIDQMNDRARDRN